MRDVKPNKSIVPFESSTGTKMNNYSRKLQRAATDFGIDETFDKASKKINEHYGIKIPISGIRNVTYKHAYAIEKQQQKQLQKMKSIYSPRHRKSLKKGTKYIVAQTDGTMIPIVNTNCTGYKVEIMLHANQTITSGKILVNQENGKIQLHFVNADGKPMSKSLQDIGCNIEVSDTLTDKDLEKITQFFDDPINDVTSKGICAKNTDKRKNRQVCYQEAKVVLAHKPDEVDPIYSASMNGVDETGKRLKWCAMQVGLGSNTFVHGVGDGAPWIVNQLDSKFGDVEHAYLIDMYHLKEYLSSAGKSIYTDSTEWQKWVNLQSDFLKSGDVTKVLHNIKTYADMPNSAEEIRTCYQYMLNRKDQLNYKFAIECELPIGSGRIESSHRFIAQERLKKPGAWWLKENATAMLAIRTHRQNGGWDEYWVKQ